MTGIGQSMQTTDTSALGALRRPPVETASALRLLAIQPASWTATAYWSPQPVGRTSAAPDGQIASAPAETIAKCVLEIRRRSGLTWDEIGGFFQVSRRSVHHWANGKPVSANHDPAIRQVLAAIRHIDRGSQADTRVRLLQIDPATGTSLLGRIRREGFAAVHSGKMDWAPQRSQTPLSQEVREARRPPPPAKLLQAEIKCPRTLAKARAVCAVRTPRTKG